MHLHRKNAYTHTHTHTHFNYKHFVVSVDKNLYKASKLNVFNLLLLNGITS